METTCPFCGRDPFHYVDNGLGYEPVAVVCCDFGDLWFRGQRQPIDDAVTIPPEEFREIGSRIVDMQWQIQRRDKIIRKLWNRRTPEPPQQEGE